MMKEKFMHCSELHNKFLKKRGAMIPENIFEEGWKSGLVSRCF